MYAPIVCPKKNAITKKTKVNHANPTWTNIRSVITKSTGICTANIHCKENFLTLARQYPKGMFIINTARLKIRSLVSILNTILIHKGTLKVLYNKPLQF